jgi:hypothetical protein
MARKLILTHKKIMLTSAKSTEILGGLGDSLAVQTHNDATSGFTTNFNIKVDLAGNLRTL